MEKPSLKEAIRIFYWAVSVGNGGTLDNTGLNSTIDVDDVDELELDTQYLHTDTDSLASSVFYYFNLMKQAQILVGTWKAKFEEAFDEIQSKTRFFNVF